MSSDRRGRSRVTCWCRHCRPRSKSGRVFVRRYDHKIQRAEAKREAREVPDEQ